VHTIQSYIVSTECQSSFCGCMVGTFLHSTHSFGTVTNRIPARDTVSSIGIVRGISLPETTNGMRHVCVFRHALALDERRVKFLPEYVNGGIGPLPGDRFSGGDVKEVWFSGTHSDM
jgi:hypothetical protein